MNSEVNAEDTELWRRLVQSQFEHPEVYDALVRQFFAPGFNRVPVLRQALHFDVPGRRLVIEFLDRLTVEELMQIFDGLIKDASDGQGWVQRTRNAITRLPRAWVLDHIEAAAEPLLRAGDDWEYRRLLELYILLDRDLTLRLARQALAQADPDIVEAGEAALGWLAEQ